MGKDIAKKSTERNRVFCKDKNEKFRLAHQLSNYNKT